MWINNRYPINRWVAWLAQLRGHMTSLCWIEFCSAWDVWAFLYRGAKIGDLLAPPLNIVSCFQFLFGYLVILWCFDCLVLCILYSYHTFVCGLRNLEVRLVSVLPYLYSCLRAWFSPLLGAWGCVSYLNLCPLGLPCPICFWYVLLLTQATSFKLMCCYVHFCGWIV